MRITRLFSVLVGSGMPGMNAELNLIDAKMCPNVCSSHGDRICCAGG